MLGVDLADESGLDALIAIPEPEVEELEGDIRADCDFATKVSEVDGFLCHWWLLIKINLLYFD